MALEDYYSGDEAFARFAKAVAPEWARCAFQEQLVQAVHGDRDLAVAIWYHLGERALAWMEQTEPPLEGWTPAQCLQTEAGTRRLKECLLRMP